MFTKAHYINNISLALTGAANSFILSAVFNHSSFLLPVLYFLVYSALIMLAGNKLFPNNRHKVRVLMLVLSPSSYYLLFAEYGFLVNIILVMLVVFFISKYTDNKKADVRFYLSAFLIGITLFVNFTLLQWYLLFLIFYYRASIPKIIIFGISVSAVMFALYVSGIFTVESAGPAGINSILFMLPIWLQILFLLITIYTGWMIADMQEVFFAGGVLTLIPAAILIITKWEGLYTNTYIAILSLSYISFSLMLLMLSVKPYRTDRYLGKVMV
jgi:hypothetical protein